MIDLTRCKVLINEGLRCLTSSWTQEAKAKFKVAYVSSSSLTTFDDKLTILVFSLYGLTLASMLEKNRDDIMRYLDELHTADQGSFNILFDKIENYLSNGWTEFEIASVARQLINEYC